MFLFLIISNLVYNCYLSFDCLLTDFDYVKEGDYSGYYIQQIKNNSFNNNFMKKNNTFSYEVKYNNSFVSGKIILYNYFLLNILTFSKL